MIKFFSKRFKFKNFILIFLVVAFLFFLIVEQFGDRSERFVCYAFFKSECSYYDLEIDKGEFSDDEKKLFVSDDDEISEEASASNEEELTEILKDIADNLDLGSFENLFDNYGKVFFESSVKQTLLDIASGKLSVDFSDVFSIFGSLFGAKFKELAPMLVSIFAIAIFYGVISALNKNSRVSVLVFNVCYCASAGLIFCETFTLIKSVLGEIIALCSEIDAVFPLLITLLSLSASGSTAEVLKPTYVFVSGAGLSLAVKVLVPIAVCVCVVLTVSTFSEKFTLKRLCSFLESAFKWIIGIVLTIFSIFTAIGGVSASGYDGALLKIFKYTLSGGLPFVGGLAKDGVDLIILGAALIKNAAGVIVALCLLISVLSSIVKIACFSLSLKLVSAFCEPITDSRFCDAISAFCKGLSMFSAILIYVFVLYFTTIVFFITAQGTLFS